MHSMSAALAGKNPAFTSKTSCTVSETTPFVTMIIPPVVCHGLDPHTGIPFMPHMAAHFAGAIHKEGFPIQIIDCFGLQPHHRQIVQEFMLMGVDENWVEEHIHPQTSLCFLYCRTIAEFIAVERLIATIKKNRPQIKIALFENVQAVTSYSLRHVAEEFIAKGVELVILGEPEDRAREIVLGLSGVIPLSSIPGVVFKENGILHKNCEHKMQTDLDSLPYPLWERFPLTGYWQAGFAHAPPHGARFLPILTSRGCPFRCRFCIAPEVNPTWRFRSAKNVVDEMERFYHLLNICDFHISDLNPTVSDKRTQEICHEILRRNLPISWKLAQGTKIETIKSEETLELMAKAGCRFLSFSPESGSSRLLKIMNKPFDHAHALKLAKKMSQLGISMQAVFLGGVPGEKESDRKLSIRYARKLIAAGVDEISLVIFTPLPGAALSKELNDFTHYSQCTPSPSWRKDYWLLLYYRYRMYLNLFFFKALYQPRRSFQIFLSFFTHRFTTKMEMSLYKQAKLYLLYYFPGFFSRLDAKTELQTTTQLEAKTA